MSLNAFFTWLAEKTGLAAAKYKMYLEEENAKARKAAKNMRMHEMMVALRPEYEELAFLLVDAITNTCGVTNLVLVKDPSQIEASDWLLPCKSGLVFRYRCYRRIGVENASSEQVCRKLEHELNQLHHSRHGSIGRPIPRLPVRVRFCADSIVEILVLYRTWNIAS